VVDEPLACRRWVPRAAAQGPDAERVRGGHFGPRRQACGIRPVSHVLGCREFNRVPLTYMGCRGTRRHTPKAARLRPPGTNMRTNMAETPQQLRKQQTPVCPARQSTEYCKGSICH
jgi:hypothetical protein